MADLADHEIRELVNTLRDIAVQHHGEQQLRARIHNAMLPALRRATQSPVADDGRQGAAQTSVESAETRMDAGSQPLFTCIGKGGEYELIGTALGAGPCRGSRMTVYRDVGDATLYFRTEADFERRMECITPQPPKATP